MTTTTTTDLTAVDATLSVVAQRSADGRTLLDGREVAELADTLTAAAAGDERALAAIALTMAETGQSHGGTTSVSAMIDLLLDLRATLAQA